MKRIRRISLRVERREVSLSITQTGTTSGESCSLQMPTDPAQPENCPDCGASWVTVAACAGESVGANTTSIHRALQQCGAHAHISASGELRICSKSLEEIGFEEIHAQKIKESL
jgi:hypothetical protein